MVFLCGLFGKRRKRAPLRPLSCRRVVQDTPGNAVCGPGLSTNERLDASRLPVFSECKQRVFVSRERAMGGESGVEHALSPFRRSFLRVQNHARLCHDMQSSIENNPYHKQGGPRKLRFFNDSNRTWFAIFHVVLTVSCILLLLVFCTPRRPYPRDSKIQGNDLLYQRAFTRGVLLCSPLCGW